MNRTEARELAVRLCFEVSAKECDAQEELERFFDAEYYASLSPEDKVFADYPDQRQKEYIEDIVLGIGEHAAELDGYVEKYAKGWPFGRISRTALAVLRVSMYEMLYVTEVPTGVAVNEAVEIAKRYDEPETVAFVNGILGSFARTELNA